MSVITKFETPAALRDASIDSTFYTDWHDVVRSLIDDHVPMSGRGRSVDPSRVDLAVREQRVFTWTGFPRPLSVRHRDDRQAEFRAADADRGVQIEYLEWAVTRNDDNTIVRVDFTCETPEYYRTLADTNRDQLLATYRRLVGDSVSTDNDLRPDPVRRLSRPTTGLHLARTTENRSFFAHSGIVAAPMDSRALYVYDRSGSARVGR